MPIEWGIDMLNVEWRTSMAAPLLLGVSIVAGLSVGWVAAWFSFRKTLTRQRQRLEDYWDQIARLQDQLSANVESYRLDRSELRLLIRGEEQTPRSIFYMNISKWCLFDQNFTRIDKEISRNHDGGPVCLFLLFDQPTRGEVLDVTSDSVLPHYEVKEFNDRFAIVAFAEPIPAGTLEITAG
jgi:hypothetical protein